MRNLSLSKKISTLLTKININLIKKLESQNSNISLENLFTVSVLDCDVNVVVVEKPSDKVFNFIKDQDPKIIQFLYAIVFSIIYDEKINKKTYKIFRKFIIDNKLQEIKSFDFNYIITIYVGKKWDYNIFFQKV